MRKFVMSAVFFIVAIVAAVPLNAVAGTADGATPAQESVCDVLKADGVSKGLYGLCVAYCEAEASSERVLDNYRRKAKDTDPAMPCLDSPPVTCPCWGDGAVLEGAFEGLFALNCLIDPSGLDMGIYGIFEGFLSAGFDSTTQAVLCQLIDPSQSIDTTISDLTPEQEAVCRADVQAVLAVDFPAGCES